MEFNRSISFFRYDKAGALIEIFTQSSSENNTTFLEPVYQNETLIKSYIMVDGFPSDSIEYSYSGDTMFTVFQSSIEKHIYRGGTRIPVYHSFEKSDYKEESFWKFDANGKELQFEKFVDGSLKRKTVYQYKDGFKIHSTTHDYENDFRIETDFKTKFRSENKTENTSNDN
ncbi:MAG: hypothetical protein SchgKO_17630 [Schleiferiaceae bacterium]